MRNSDLSWVQLPTTCDRITLNISPKSDLLLPAVQGGESHFDITISKQDKNNTDALQTFPWLTALSGLENWIPTSTTTKIIGEKEATRRRHWPGSGI
jgi:hypothetical protein